jgi:hypothetical protein
MLKPGLNVLITLAVSIPPTIASAQVSSDGPDLIVGFLFGTQIFGRESSGSDTHVGIAAATNSCNRGNTDLNWLQFPDANHPVITVNIYRLANDRFEQLGQSWAKHGFWATNASDCFGIPDFPHESCKRSSDVQHLGPGCSDLYGAGLMNDPNFLGPRSKINPSTGAFVNPMDGTPDAAGVKSLDGYPPSTPLQRMAYVLESDLLAQNAKFFVEGEYIAADDASAGNARNNVTYREIKPLLLQSGLVDLQSVGEEVHGEPALKAWDGAKFSEHSEIEAPGGQRSNVLVASKAIKISDDLYRYEYAIYNMNSDLAIQEFQIPASNVEVRGIGFKAVGSVGEIWSNDPWKSSVADGKVTWATKMHSESPTSNALRWGTTYNFWFVAGGEPTTASATLTHFKARQGSSAPDGFEVEIVAPRAKM